MSANPFHTLHYLYFEYSFNEPYSSKLRENYICKLIHITKSRIEALRTTFRNSGYAFSGKVLKVTCTREMLLQPIKTLRVPRADNTMVQLIVPVYLTKYEFWMLNRTVDNFNSRVYFSNLPKWLLTKLDNHLEFQETKLKIVTEMNRKPDGARIFRDNINSNNRQYLGI